MNRQSYEEIADWLKERRVGEVECLVSDMGGIARGKILPTTKFLSAVRSGTLALASAGHVPLSTCRRAPAEEAQQQ